MMLSERDIELASADAFDFVWGNLPAARRAGFNRHLSDCRYCQAVLEEYGEIGEIIKQLPPHVEPPASLEERTVAAMVAALAEQRAKAHRRPDAQDQAATRVYPIPRRPAPAGPLTGPPARPPAGPQAPVPAWRRYRGRLAAVAAVAAAVIAAAVIVPLSLGGGLPAGAVTFRLVPPPGSGHEASGTAVARPDATGSWHITLTVHHLTNFEDQKWYECWYVSRDGRRVASAGTFVVPYSGSGTFPMTSAADPGVFPTMQIRLESPGRNGGIQGAVVLSGEGERASR
jgi:hypothetical protein